MKNSTKNKKILVVDDEPKNLRLLEAVLAPRGYDLKTVSSGQEALDIIRTFMPDLVLLDIMMSGMDGYQVCKRIKEDGSLPYIPIIFLTAIHTDQASISFGLDVGGDDYIRKPLDNLELLSRIRACLRVKELYDELSWTKAKLSRYVSLSTLRMIEKSSLEGGIEIGQTRDITVLFSDIRGFAHIAEGMKPEEVFHTLNLCLSKQIGVVEAHGGVVDKLTGDQMMAVFEGPDMARSALRCGISIIQVLQELEPTRGGDWIAVGIGIDMGSVYIGSIGSEKMKDYTAVGNTVNTAARLCGRAEKFQILFTETARRLIKREEFQYRSVGKIFLKGLMSPIEAFELICGRAETPLSPVTLGDGKISLERGVNDHGQNHGG